MVIHQSKKYSISHKIDFTYEDNEKVIFDNKKGYRVYKGTSIENAKTWMGFYKEDFVVDINFVVIVGLSLSVGVMVTVGGYSIPAIYEMRPMAEIYQLSDSLYTRTSTRTMNGSR